MKSQVMLLYDSYAENWFICMQVMQGCYLESVFQSVLEFWMSSCRSSLKFWLAHIERESLAIDEVWLWTGFLELALKFKIRNECVDSAFHCKFCCAFYLSSLIVHDSTALQSYIHICSWDEISRLHECKYEADGTLKLDLKRSHVSSSHSISNTSRFFLRRRKGCFWCMRQSTWNLRVNLTLRTWRRLTYGRTAM